MIALKTNDSYCYLLPRQGRKQGDVIKAPEKCSESCLFFLRESSFLIERGHYTKGTFVHLLKKQSGKREWK